MTFSSALEMLKTGERMTREGWNGPRQFVGLQRPDDGSKMDLPYLYIFTVRGEYVPWVASQTDLLAEDWQPVGRTNQ